MTGDLMRQCPRGRVTGILTKQESSLYVIVQVRKVVATGYCVYDEPSGQAGEATAMRPPAPHPPEMPPPETF